MNTKDRLYYSAKRFFLAFSYVALYWICGVLLRLFIVNSSLVSSAMADGIFIITSFILYFAFGYYKRDKERYHVPLKVSSFGFIFVVFLVVYGATQSLGLWYLTNFGDMGFSQHQTTANSLGVTIRLIFQIVLAPITEELLFRGVVYNILKSKDKKSGYTMTWFSAVICSSLMFGLMHGNTVQIITAMLSGFWFCLIYELTGKLWFSCLFHMIYNTISQFGFVASVLPYQHVVVCVILVLAATVLCVYMITRLDTEHKYLSVD